MAWPSLESSLLPSADHTAVYLSVFRRAHHSCLSIRSLHTHIGWDNSRDSFCPFRGWHPHSCSLRLLVLRVTVMNQWNASYIQDKLPFSILLYSLSYFFSLFCLL